ncbi:MAG: MarR family transcriptional regulator [Candidatus Omnitrophota bacterium]
MPEAGLMGFADKLSQVMPVLIREFIRDEARELYHGHVTPPQVLVMDFLFANGESKMKELASFMMVSTAATTGIVDRLVKAGYVRRLFEPTDRRIIKVNLTFKGSELLRKIKEQRRRIIMHTFSKVSQEDRMDYLRIISQIRDAFVKEQAESRS